MVKSSVILAVTKANCLTMMGNSEFCLFKTVLFNFNSTDQPSLEGEPGQRHLSQSIHLSLLDDTRSPKYEIHLFLHALLNSLVHNCKR